MALADPRRGTPGREYGDTSSITADIFTETLGRAPTEQELKFVNNQWKAYGVATHTNKVQGHHFGSRREVLGKYKGLIDNATNYANQAALALGYTLTPEQLASVPSQFINLGGVGFSIKDSGTANGVIDKSKDFINSYVNRIGAENFRNPAVNDEQLGNVQRIFQEIYGRAASADEANYFAKEIAQGKSAYELGQELQSLPEYQRVQAQKDRASLDTELQAQQQQVFQRAQPEIIASFMRAGRLNSTGLQSAMAKAQQDLDRERQLQLTNVGVQDNATIRGNAFQDFLRRDQPYQAGRETFSPAALYNTSLGFLNQGVGRQREIDDYYRQQSDYNRYMDQQQQGNRQAALYGLGGQVLGAGLQAGIGGLFR